MNQSPFSVAQALTFGFRAFGNNFWLIIGISCLGLTNDIVSRIIIATIGKNLLGQEVEVSTHIAKTVKRSIGLTTSKIDIDLPKDSTSAQMAAWFFLLLIELLSAFITLFLLMGLNQISLDIYDTGTSSFNRLWAPLPKLGTFILASILYSCICAFGTLLFIIPGIIWALMYGFTDLIVIDSDRGPIEALQASNRLTYGYKWDLLFFAFVAIVIVCASMITIIGPFILMYVMFLSRAYIYRTLQQQWTAQHEPPTPFMP
jgi:uncharacterized membrane protein